MSTQERAAEDQYEAQNDANPPVSADVVDNDYKSRTGQSHIPVVSDEAGNGELDDNAVPSNSDEQLRKRFVYREFVSDLWTDTTDTDSRA